MLTDDDRTRRVLLPARDVVPVLGAGVSQGAGIPGVIRLAEHLLEVGEFAAERPPAQALFDVVDALAPRWREDHLRPLVAEFFSAAPPTGNPMARALIRVPSRFIVTLNYDLLVEQTAIAAGMVRRDNCPTRKPIFSRRTGCLSARHGRPID